MKLKLLLQILLLSCFGYVLQAIPAIPVANSAYLNAPAAFFTDAYSVTFFTTKFILTGSGSGPLTFLVPGQTSKGGLVSLISSTPTSAICVYSPPVQSNLMPTYQSTAGGSLLGSEGYLFQAPYVGGDSFTFTVKDSLGNTSDIALVNISVGRNIVQDAVRTVNIPQGVASSQISLDAQPFDSSNAVTFNLLDSGGNPATSLNTPSGGVVHNLRQTSSTSATVEYIPGNALHDSFKYSVTENGVVYSAKILIDAGPPLASSLNRYLVPQSQHINMLKYVPYTINLQYSYNSPYSLANNFSGAVYSISSPPLHGSLSHFNSNTGTVNYTPNFGFIGEDSFEYTVQGNVAGVSGVVQSGPGKISLGFVPLKLYVADSNGVSISNLSLEAIAGSVANLPINSGVASSIELTPVGTRAYVCYENKISVINTLTDTWIHDVIDTNGDLESLSCMAISPLGNIAYTCNSNNNNISIVNMVTDAVTGRYVNDPYQYINNPVAIAFPPDGLHAYVACNGNRLAGIEPSVGVIDVRTNTVIQQVTGANFAGNFTDFVIDTDSRNFSLGYLVSKGGFIYLIHPVSTLNPSDGNNTVVAVCSGFNSPTKICLLYGALAYVLNSGNNTVSLVDVNPEITSFRVRGSVSGSFNNPQDIVGLDSSLIPACVLNKNSGTVNIIKYSPSGSWLSAAVTSTISGFTSPTCLAYITEVQDIPIAFPQQVSCRSNSINSITLEALDAAGDLLIYDIASLPSHGTLYGLNAATGDVTYTTNIGYTGIDTFTFTARTSAGVVTSPATVTIRVGIDPIATPQTVTVKSGSSNNAIRLQGTDPLGLPLIFGVATNPSHGTLSNFNIATGAIQYTPTVGYAGIDTFTFSVINSVGEASSPATVNIKVDNPIANPLAVSVGINSKNQIMLSGFDNFNQSLTYAIATQPSHGTLSAFNAQTGAVTYTPNTSYSGYDSFTFRVTDAYGFTSAATGLVTINVSANPGVSVNQVCASALQNVATPIMMNGVTDKSNLVFSGDYYPNHGTINSPLGDYTIPIYGNIRIQSSQPKSVTPTSAVVMYTSSGSYIGQDAGYQVNAIDFTTGAVSSNTRVYVNILPPSQRAYVTNTHGGVSKVSSIDVATGNANSDISGLPNYGSANCLAVTPDGTKAYVCYWNPNTNVSHVAVINTATNTYLYNVTDASGLLNDPIDIAISPDGSKAYICNLGGSSVSILNVATDTIIGNVSGSITYPISVAFTPDGSRAYVVSQGTTGYGINPYVTMINAQNDTFGSTVSGLNLNAYSFNDFVVSPDANFGYLVSNGPGGSTRGHVYIIDTNPASPTYNTNVGSIDDSAYNFNNLFCMAIAPNGLQAYVVNQGNNAVSVVDLNPTSPTYRKVTGVVTGGTFSFAIYYCNLIAFTADGTQAYVTNSGNGTVSIINTATNMVTQTITGYTDSSGSPSPSPIGVCFLSYAPVANSQSVSCTINTQSNTITLSGSDPRNQALTYTLRSNPSYGTLHWINQSAGTLYYRPYVGYAGPDSFTFTVTNSSGQTSNPGTVAITVNDTPPNANAQITAEVLKNSTGNIFTLYGTDATNGTFRSFNVPSTTTHSGTLTNLTQFAPEAAHITYAAPAGYTGNDSFQFTVTNAFGQTSSPATVTIPVVVDTPVAQSQTVAVSLNSRSNQFQLGATDPGGQTLTYALATPPTYGTFLGGFNTATGLQNYAPNVSGGSLFPGLDTFTFTATNSPSNATSSAATVTLTGTPAANARAYVPYWNGSAVKVAILDTLTGNQISTVSGGLSGQAVTDMVVSPDGNFAYLCYGGANTIGIIPTATNVVYEYVSDPLSLLNNPYTMAISPNGTKGYVCNLYGNTVSIVNLNNAIPTTYRQVIGNVTAGSFPFNAPDTLAFTPDGTRAYVVNSVSKTVSMINVSTDTVTAQMSFGATGTPTDIIISPDGSYAYVVVESNTYGTHGSVYILDTDPSSGTYNIFIGTINDGRYPFNAPYTMTILPNGLKGYVANIGNNTVSVVDLNPSSGTYRQVIKSITYSSFNQPEGLVCTSDNTKVYVVNYAQGGSGSVNIITTSSDTVTGTLPGSEFVASQFFAFLPASTSFPTANTPSTVNVVVNSTNNTITLTGSDTGGSALTFAVPSSSAHGALSQVSLSATSAVYKYVPTYGYAGADSFMFTVTNASGQTSAPATVSIAIADTIPTAAAQTLSVAVNTTNNTITLSGFDAGSSPLTFTVPSSSANGTLTLVSSTSTRAVYYYTPAHNYFGQDTFTFTVTNGFAQTSSPATVTIHVVDVPTANAPSPITVVVNTRNNIITLTGYDPAGDILTFYAPFTQYNGQLVFYQRISSSSVQYYYTPPYGYAGPDAFAFWVTNSSGNASQPATANITILDAQPFATGVTLNALSGLTQQINLFGVDLGNQPLTFALSGAAPTLGSITGLPQTSSIGSALIMYTANSGVTSGTDTFNFTVTNPSLMTSNPATVNVNITSIPSGGSKTSAAVTNAVVSKYAGT